MADKMYHMADEIRSEMERIPNCTVIFYSKNNRYELVMITDRFLEVLQLQRETFEDYFFNNLNVFFHPDDRISLESKLYEMLRAPGTIYPFRMRLNVNGEYRWFRGNMEAREADDGGKLIYVTTMDITEDHNRHARDKVRDILLAKVLDTTQTCMFWKDTERRFVGVNQAFLDFYGFPSEDVLIGKTDEDMGWHDDPEPFRKDEERVLKGASVRLARGTCRVHGENRDIFATKAPAYDGDTIIGLVGTFLDATETLSQQRKIEELSKELARSLEKEKQLNADMGRFMSRLSHELRTPMNAVIGLSALGLEQETLEGAKNYLENIRISGRYLLSIINEVLELNKAEAGDVKLNPVESNLKSLFREMHAIIDPLALKKGISVVMDEKGILYEDMCFDIVRLKQILINLLNNAVKFTERGGHINLSVGQELLEGNIRNTFTITDDGCGISESFLPSIFVPFAQENRNPSKYGSGTGLGLTITRTLIQMMGGDIRVESKEGEGTAFYVTVDFPACCPVSPAVEKERREPKTYDLIRGMRVLLAEDNVINQKVACGILGRVDICVDVADNGEAAADMFQNSPEGCYGAILMDIHMPVMNGLMATRKIRAMDRDDAKTVPIIAMSADVFDESIIKARECGMTGYITKPLDMEALYDELETQIKIFKDLTDIKE